MHILWKEKKKKSVSASFEHDRTSQLVPCVCQTVTRRHRVWLGCLVELKAPLRGEGLLFLPNPPLGRLGLNPIWLLHCVSGVALRSKLSKKSRVARRRSALTKVQPEGGAGVSEEGPLRTFSSGLWLDQRNAAWLLTGCDYTPRVVLKSVLKWDFKLPAE